MDVCLRVLKESNKSRFDSYSVRNSVLIKSHITFRDCRVHIFFRQPFSKQLYTNSIIPWRVTLTGVLDIGVPCSLGRWPATCLRKSSTWSSVGFSTSPPIPWHVSHRTSTIVLGPFRRFSMMGYVVRAWRVLAVSFRRMGRRYRPIRRLISVVFAMFCRPTMTKCGISNDFRRVSLLIMDWIKSNTPPNSLLLPYLDTGDSISLDISKLNSALENK